MTIKPIKSDNSEPEVSQQHRECLNKISTPKSPVSTSTVEWHVIRLSVTQSLTHGIEYEEAETVFCMLSLSAKILIGVIL